MKKTSVLHARRALAVLAACGITAAAVATIGCASTKGAESGTGAAAAKTDSAATAPSAAGTYTFGTKSGSVAVEAYSAKSGRGFAVFNKGSLKDLHATDDGIKSSKSFQFKLAAANGNYELTVVTTATDIISEAVTEPIVYLDENGAKATYTPPFDEASGIPLIGVPKKIESAKPFQVAVVDGVLDLTFIRAESDITLSSIEIKEIPCEKREKPYLVAIGDSTTNLDYQDKCSWGNVIDKGMVSLPETLGGFFNAGASGADDVNFIAWNRLEAALLNTRPGDIVTVNMGINQAKKYQIGLIDVASSDSRAATLPLMENYYIEGIKQRGGIPVITTITARGPYDKAGTPEDNGGLYYLNDTAVDADELFVAGKRYTRGEKVPANTWANSRHQQTYNIKLYAIANNYALDVFDLGIWGEGFFQSLTEDDRQAFNEKNGTDFATVYDMVKHGYYADQNHYHDTLGVVFAQYMLDCVDKYVKGEYVYPYSDYEPVYLKAKK